MKFLIEIERNMQRDLLQSIIQDIHNRKKK